MFDLLTVVNAQTDGQNFFVNPGLKGPLQTIFATPAWSVGSTQTIKWRTNYENFTITLWQQDPDFEESAIGLGLLYSWPFQFSIDAQKLTPPQAKANEFDWVMQTFDFDLSESNVFFLWLAKPGIEGITSQYFNITEESTSLTSKSSTASSSSTASRASSSAASTESSAAASISASRTPAAVQATNSGPAPPENSSMSSGTKIGFDVGVGFGFAILVLWSVLHSL
jgi:hypothetical protein